MAHEVESMFYFGETPWHGLGVEVEELLTAEEAIKAAGLNWTVRGTQVAYYDQDTSKWVVIPSFRLNLREAQDKKKNKTPLGIVSDQYSVLQNHEAFSFMDELVGEGRIKYETAGSLKNGRVIWLLARVVDKGIFVGGFDDETRKYLLLRNSHDGSSGVRVYGTAVRVVCWNTLQISSQSAEGEGFYWKHQGDIKERLSTAREVLEIADQKFQEYQEAGDKLIKFPLKKQQVNDFLTAAFPGTDSRHNDKTDSGRFVVFNTYKQGDPVLVGPKPGTGWAALQALTYYTTHVTHHDDGSVEKKANRFQANAFGSRASIARRGYRFLLDLAA
jgi:phage/plasmid-like protein (TIGR03299 family)